MDLEQAKTHLHGNLDTLIKEWYVGHLANNDLTDRMITVVEQFVQDITSYLPRDNQ